MALGTPITNKFQIGNAELRIGPMNLANKLTQANSVGLLQSATVNFQQESVDLEAGLPKTLIDTVITKTNVTIDAQAYEFSRKNMRVMMNNGTEVAGSVSEYAGEVAVSSLIIGTTTTETLDTTLLLADVVVGDMVVVYDPASPQNVSLIKITAKAARTAPAATMATITFDATATPLLFSAPAGTLIYKANQLGLGASTATNYFTADVIGLEHSTGRPTGWKFWKVAVSGGLEYAYNSDNFAVTPLKFKVLMPTAADYTGTGLLTHVAGLIPSHPFGLMYAG